ncbi:MAG: GNAT family N-acetyltransferase [Brevibacterium sp.]|uniref:GNAT family N-acetyltransferase n=1 Tax=Brevibacterium sp. TaxID=1701 RepID=UPI002647ADBC|nr:GNAT family protein [Brevibacterium sp.]MDN5806108.1 GNAT family N-acetyltransferase [Brevibacterium sp.]MDN5832583.1 GNAT family N-acetyltransferase [Brevibacterium sp.]MDN5875783.1 GNAT family N-acetyltransferase [Brevibacterium sp.]MDN6123600.1 GNAT family N-acetyltransferase [Brevibacterium sp.]MDN6132940.1 GNAT family N-acetyltransferase [Brevibacterium sp.]
MTDANLTDWAGVEPPRRETIHGRYVDLEPLDAERHSDSLFAAASADGSDERFRYLPQAPQIERADFDEWMTTASESPDPMFFAVVDRSTGAAEGRQALMRIDADNGVVEIGNILWGPSLARTRGATEALFLVADLVFASGYRRFEWKCDNDNVPSKKAATRFGFTVEGLFRQHLVINGRNRDTAWFSIIDSEWPRLRAAYVQWLDETNFDESGAQRSSLSEFMSSRAE